MEFGIFLNGYIPGPGAHDTECEHAQLFAEARYAVLADKHNWKYAWFGEHHSGGYELIGSPEIFIAAAEVFTGDHKSNLV